MDNKRAEPRFGYASSLCCHQRPLEHLPNTVTNLLLAGRRLRLNSRNNVSNCMVLSLLSSSIRLQF